MDSANDVRAYLNGLHQAVWELAAIALALRTSDIEEPDQRTAAERVLVEAGMLEVSPGGVHPVSALVEAAGGDETRVAAQAATAILQSAALLSGADSWTGQDDEAILAQGRASAQGV